MESSGIPQADFRLIEDWSVKVYDESTADLEKAYRDLSTGQKVAIISSNDSYARAAFELFLNKGAKPHRDFGVAGIDGIGTAYNQAPVLTTVKTNTEEMGRMAVRCLLDRIMRSPGAPARQLSPSPVFECGETL